MIILRLLHIFSGVFWVGTTLFMWLFLTPTVKQMGADGPKVMRTLLNTTQFSQVIGITSIITLLSGLWMYYKVSNGFDADWMSLTSSIVLSIGAIAGIGASGHGASVLRPTSEKIAALGNEIAAGGGPPTPEQGAAMAELQAKMAQGTQMTAIMMIIAVAGMASFRYF